MMAASLERGAGDILLPHHDGVDGLAEVGMRQADHGRFDDTGHGVDHVLDFLRIDVEAAGDDQVLGAADDGDVAVGIAPAHVAGLEPAVGGEFLGGLFRHLPVADEDVVALAPGCCR